MRLSSHGIDRIVQRVGINKSSARRLAERALERGYTLDDLKGSLGIWVKAKVHADDPEHPIVYGDKLFLFSSDYVLITVMQLPSGMICNSTDRYIIGKPSRRSHYLRFEEDEWFDWDEEEEDEEEEDMEMSSSRSLH
ncbi:MAG: hypothetical protein IKG46_05180 [Solobacterium sp.]|nr:hypothetical protein [Solobacterium sp.]